MASKVVWYREAWWVRTRWEGNKKRDRRIGPTKEHKREAAEIARKINAALALGTFEPDREETKPLACDEELHRWHDAHRVTMSHAYEVNAGGHIDNHLIPYFGTKDLRTLTEEDLLGFVQHKVNDGYAPKTVGLMLAVLRRVLTLLHRAGRISRNPASRFGEIVRRADRRLASEVTVVDAWTRGEAEKLLAVAQEHDPRFSALLHFLLATGARRGEALALKWEDIDFERSRITIRRSLTQRRVSTPKSGRARTVLMAPSLASVLFDLLAERRREAMQRGWPEIPAWVFCSEAGTAADERNVGRMWDRVRRRAQKFGVRPLRLHAARHTFATLALQAGKSVRWVADQLGHADPALTLRVYAHALPSEAGDLAFIDFGATEGSPDGSKRLYPALERDGENSELRNSSEILARREGFEPPTLRFEA